MQKSIVVTTLEVLIQDGLSPEEILNKLVEEALIMPPCNKYGNYDWDTEAADATST